MNRHRTSFVLFARSASSAATTSRRRSLHFFPLFFLFLLVLSAGPLRGQEDSIPDFPETGETWPDFIPTGWHLFDSVAGDLNKDKLADLVLVAERDAAGRCGGGGG